MDTKSPSPQPPESSPEETLPALCDSPSGLLLVAYEKGTLHPSLPFPDFTTLNSVLTSESPPKKTHARRRPPGHVPRPRNGFILFRCDFVKQKKIPQSIEGNHRNISRIAGFLWRQMTKEQRKPWMLMAEAEKKMHEKRFPGYRYQPRSAVDVDREGRGKEKGRVPSSEKVRRVRNPSSIVTTSEHDFDSVQTGRTTDHTPIPPSIVSGFPRRPSSCPPPGAIPIQNVSVSHTTLDDTSVSRRPSRTTFYQSVSSSEFPYPPSNGAAPMHPMHHVMPTCPPGWVTTPNNERWTEWSEDVEKELSRHVLMRNIDYDNSFQNGVPQWTNGLFQSHSPHQDASTPVFTNPFEPSESYQKTNTKPEEVSPHETTPSSSETQSGRELENYTLSPPPSELTCDSGYLYPSERPTYLTQERFGRLSLEDQPRVLTARTSEDAWDSRPIPMISNSKRFV